MNITIWNQLLKCSEFLKNKKQDIFDQIICYAIKSCLWEKWKKGSTIMSRLNGNKPIVWCNVMQSFETKSKRNSNDIEKY